ncbi:hydroxymethylglutaryl-CoA lyase [Sphingobium sp.]|uniref:hydroxymethylglutaryl-CoA lyase n=1 Tax=Sphingobium sp. TaxID=1912891 RepID=UPI0028BEBC93|nr:hydroxymethylglutaryl-CoA lyase [Sphingobium sp.]
MTDLTDLYPADRIVLREVGLRDGLQMVRQFPSTHQKQRWIELARDAGVRNFEVGSYLPAQRYPQFADIEDIVSAGMDKPGIRLSTLVLNKRGAMRALEGGAHEIMFVVSASEAHNLANANRSRSDTLREIEEAIALRKDMVDAPVAAVAIAMSFGCSIAGKSAVEPKDVLDIAGRALEAGAQVINIADTVGYGGPTEVRTIVRQFRSAFRDVPLAFHFHDTRGVGLANAAAALEEGVTILDASIGGLGGCPFAPGATGNIVFEDLVFLAHTMGLDTGIDPTRLMDVRQLIDVAMPNEQTYGQFRRAGLPKA